LSGALLLLEASAASAWEVETTTPDSFGHSSLTITGDILDASSGEALIITCTSVNWIFATDGWTAERIIDLSQSKGILSIGSKAAATTLSVRGTAWAKNYGAYSSESKEDARRAVTLLRSKDEFVVVSLSLPDGSRDEGRIYSDDGGTAAPDKFDRICGAK
jgi:hypothetical protein